jgi:hypothetical protein
LQRTRPASEALRDGIGLEHAVASRRLFSDGADVLFDYAEVSGDRDLRQLVVVRSGQTAFAEVVTDYLRRITFGDDGWPNPGYVCPARRLPVCRYRIKGGQ